MGLEGQKAFPFIYTFVNHSDDPWVKSQMGLANLNCLGPVVPAMANGIPGAKTINVMLDPDYNFKLLDIRYSVYKYLGGQRGTNYYWYIAPATPAFLTNQADALENDNIAWKGEPLSNYIRITLSYAGSGNSAIQYGGPHMTPYTPAYDVNGRFPVPLETIQGYDYGVLTTRTPCLLPRQGCMVFDITNDSSYDVVVAAAIYGMKIRV
jgi:hypothetical protein